MPQTLEQGDIFGRIGKAFGEGAGEQIGRERVANALKPEEGKQFNPLEATQKLIRAQASPEEIASYVPLIRQQYQNQQYLEEEKNKLNPPAQTIPSEKGKVNLPESKLTSPQEIKQFKSELIQPIDTQDIDQLGRKLVAQGQALDRTDARAKAREILQTNLVAQEEKVKNLTDEINQRMALDLQTTGLGNYKDLAGEIQNRLLDQAKYDVFKNGMTTQEASDKVNKIVLDLGKALTQARKVGTDAGYLPFSGKNEKTRSADLRAARKEFEDYGFQELYDDEVAAIAGITPMKAASILDPVKNDKFLKEVKGKGKGKIFHSFTTRLGDRDLDKMADAIRPEDNILSLEKALRDERIDISDFKEKLLEPRYYNKLTEKQKRQLNKPAANSLFDDLLFSNL